VSFPTVDTEYTSFDGGTRETVRARRPDRYRYWDGVSADEVTIPRGAGLSYTAASFASDGVSVGHGAFDRILGFDAAERAIEVEAGITLGALYDFLTPRGLYVPIQPGYPLITVGGCAAVDVHGKNQFRDGTFISLVRSARLFHPAHGTIEIGPDKNRDLFRLTCGGYGLTGNLLSLTLAVRAIPSNRVRVKTTFIDDIHQLPNALAAAAARADLVFTWHDLTKNGRGFLKEGSFVPDACQGVAQRSLAHPLTSESRGSWRLPFFNGVTTPAFNRAYYAANRAMNGESTLEPYEFLFPVHDKQAYFKLFGRRGFFEYQTIIPLGVFDDYIDRVRDRLAKHPIPITLASAKYFKGDSELLRFTGDGICLSLNYPRTAETIRFAGFLDELIMTLGCRPNLIKDSRLSAGVAAKTYPGYETFRRELRAFDPRRLYQSELSRRLEL
jgi:decaprenylphospho-beta-D-ribofuranose 2-oxidase